MPITIPRIRIGEYLRSHVPQITIPHIQRRTLAAYGAAALLTASFVALTTQTVVSPFEGMCPQPSGIEAVVQETGRASCDDNTPVAGYVTLGVMQGALASLAFYGARKIAKER